jgi:tetratricopeptide (TPR) repeat protein
MPFGQKEGIDFDKVYENILKPAIKKADMIPLREDEELSGGIIHKTMIEKIIFSDFVIADISIENANVFYELGIRHMASKNNTLLVSSKDIKLFDIKPVRYHKYSLENEKESEELAKKLQEMIQKNIKSSPVYDFFDFEIDREKYKKDIELFKEQTKTINEIETRLFIAKAKKDIQTLQNLEKDVIKNSNLLKTLYIIYRDLKEYKRMLNLYEKMPENLKENKFILEQKAFALNRLNEKEEAKILLENIIKKFGEDSETLGILGRIYKDLWKETKNTQYLKKAINIYKKGFETNLNDYYSGINLITLALYDGNHQILQKYLPIVEVAVEKALKKQKDYWTLATMFELSFIKQDCKLTKEILDEIIVCDKEKWMLETTLNNLNFLMEKVDKECLKKIIKKFENLIRS